MTSVSRKITAKRQLYWVRDNVIAGDFPDVESALRDPDGLLAIGGDLSPNLLLSAYRRGIFPWFSHGQPILWWSPDPRCVLRPEDLRISRSLARTLRRRKFHVTFNRAFSRVIAECAAPRRNTSETWITEEMKAAYSLLRRQGWAVSVECWNSADQLVGGLYGLALGRVFFGESMFSLEPDASKVALAHLVHELGQRDFRLIDCQVHSRHLQTLGATPMPRQLFVRVLRHYCAEPAAHEWPRESVLP